MILEKDFQQRRYFSNFVSKEIFNSEPYLQSKIIN